ncbi:MAG TPA: AMP-binding protein, partial [Bryobacteraceae bacterium]
MRFSNPQSASVVDLLFHRAASHPDSIAFTFLADRTGEEQNLSFSELLRVAGAIAADLRRELQPGDRALLVYPQGLDFIKAFFGCLLAGVIAVPANPIRRNQATNRLRTIASDAGISAILTVSKLSTILRDNFAAWGGEQPKWFCTDLQNTAGAFDGDASAITSTTIALLQYTSGSTGAPKGVVVTHGNILHNQATIAQACGHSESTIFVGWLPLFHDMGLMGNILQPLYLGIRSVLFSTTSFLASPAKWLRTISDYKGTTSGGPNFAYDHCASRIADEQLAGVDLSSWNVAFNGAEPVRADTLDRFTRKFERFGFRRDAFHPCYGMAEATLFITGKRVAEEPLTRAFDRDALARQRAVEADAGARLASSGKAWGDTRIVVVDPESKRMCGDGEIGEIWVHSPSVAEGYWRNPEATTETFRANLAEFAGTNFLRTGDLGFLSGGKLFVTGRCKELMILRGRNYYPQDIEAAAIRSSPDLGPAAAAFADGESDDAVAIIVELDRSHRKTLDDIPARTKLVEAIQTAVFEELDLRLSEIAFVPAGALPRTTSGKLQRFACRRDYLENRLQVLYRERAGGGVESASTAIAPDSIVCRLIASVLRCPVSEVRADRSLASLGMDSLGAAELQARLRGELGIECRIEDALAAPTIGDLLSKCSASSEEPGSASAVATKELPLTETQQSLWFPWKAAPQSSAYNVTAALRIRSGVDVAAARMAMRCLIARHPILAARFTENENGEPRQHPGAVVDGFAVERDAALLDEQELRNLVAAAVERQIDLRNGPVFRLEMFLNAVGGTVLVFVGHHIVVDLWSMSILIRDFASFYSGARATSEPDWSFAQYVEDCEGILRGDAGARAAAYWAAKLEGDRAALELPVDKPVPVARSARGGRLYFEIPKELEHSLRKMAAAQDATLYMLLLCAYQALLHGSTGQDDVTVGTPVSGRTDSRWFDGVGCFINIVPIRSRSSGQLRFVDALAIAKQEVLGAVANQVYSRRAVVNALEHSKTPWFETMFALQRPHMLAGAAPLIFGIEEREFSLGGLTATSFAAAPADVQFDLSLMMVDGADELAGCFEYRTDLFEGAAIERWKRRFVALLENIARDPEQPLRELAPFAPGEREWVLQQLRGERLDVPRQTLHGMIETQAGRTPDGIALEMGDRRFSYAQLNHAANVVAKELIARGVGPEDRVGVLLERSAESLVAMLGVWKAGAVYVPFDSAQSMSRFDLTSLATVITRPRFRDPNAMPIGRCEELLSRDDPGNPGVSVDPENAAYIIYTSGSSGTPKGVIVSHRNAVNFGLAQLELVPVVESDRLLQLAAFTFDASLSDVMMAWFRGACLCVAPEEGRVPGPALERFIRERGITMITVAASVLEALEASPYPALRQIISTAEACRRETVQRWATGYALFNGYGPTEATIGATLSRCTWNGQEAGWRPPIGRPFSNYEVYILDANLEPAPIGTAGEIFVGGEGVA